MVFVVVGGYVGCCAVLVLVLVLECRCQVVRKEVLFLLNVYLA